ncbi:MAG: hypothetical protein Athens071416_94 [Parcubacteria group bacterium Athens0714_16]|nr:MAG: hypothetical protein Athens071416_94 [Parcubacteria group bacterium Athens0714_16]
MKNLFYSLSEKILFWVVGYTDNSPYVKEIVDMLNSNAKKLAELVSADEKDVCTVVIEKSRRYKNMRVFYIKTLIIPLREGAWTIPEDTTMHKYLSD